MGQLDLAASPGAGELLLDPFAFQPGVASRISGLGGGIPLEGNDGYAFHTLYVDVAEGPASFIVRFNGLAARRGSLQLRVHMLDGGGRAILVNSARIQLNRLIAKGGETSIRFEGFRGVTFALYGSIIGDTDAAADGLIITLDRPAYIESEAQVAIEARNTVFRREDVRPEARLLSLSTPTLAEPVSQPATERQTHEQCFSRRMAELGLGGAAPRTQWAHVYVAQALDRYGVLQPAARGLGFGPAAEAMENFLKRSGVDAIIAPPPPTPDTIRRDLVNFDFLWSIDTAGSFASPEIGQWFIDAAFRCLRPGGLAVHVVPFDPSTDQRDSGSEGFGRGMIERITLGAISREHEVAQIKLIAPDPLIGPLEGQIGGNAGAFGIIMRKALLPS
jgi:hypothetical protein